jgi:hypothetical protein
VNLKLSCQRLRCENLKLDYVNAVKHSIKFLSSRLLCSNLILWFVAEKSQKVGQNSRNELAAVDRAV